MNSLGLYVERGLPFQMHMHICQGLRSAFGSEYFDRIGDFEKEKIYEIHKYNARFKGIETNIPLLYSRIQMYMDLYNGYKAKGMHPFVWGRDYYPTMRPREASTIADSAAIVNKYQEVSREHELQAILMEECRQLYSKMNSGDENQEHCKGLFKLKCIGLDEFQMKKLFFFAVRYRLQALKDFRPFF